MYEQLEFYGETCNLTVERFIFVEYIFFEVVKKRENMEGNRGK